MDEPLSSLFGKADTLRRQIDDGSVEDTQVRILIRDTDVVDCPARVYRHVRPLQSACRTASSLQRQRKYR